MVGDKYKSVEKKKVGRGGAVLTFGVDFDTGVKDTKTDTANVLVERGLKLWEKTIKFGKQSSHTTTSHLLYSKLSEKVCYVPGNINYMLPAVLPEQWRWGREASKYRLRGSGAASMASFWVDSPTS